MASASENLSVECLRELGTGTYGSVYLVRIAPLKKRYAMKVLAASQLSSKQREMIRKEIDIMSMLRHCNVIRYKRAYVTKESEIHIIMEYADLGDLSQVMKRSSCSTIQLHDWFYQIVCGLQFIHSQKVIHRDLKPSNIFLKSSCGCVAACAKNAVKIGDFGVSTVLRRDADYKTATSIGTPYYLSPEICQGVAYDFKTDLWSLGCVLYEMMTSRPPFLATNVEGLVQKIVTGNYPLLPGKSDPVLVGIVSKLIVTNPEQRPSSAFLKQLFGLQMDKTAKHTIEAIVPRNSRNKVSGDENAVQPTKSRRCFSAIENHPSTPTPKRLKEVNNLFKFDSPAQQTSPMSINGKPNDIRRKIDELLTRLDRALGSGLLAECVDTYRQTNSIDTLKGVLGPDRVAFVSSVMRLVYLEDQCFNRNADAVANF